MSTMPPALDWFEYAADAAWRTAALADTLRERAANMREHEASGMPPLLHFEHEQVADARDFEPPCNYRLLRITRCESDGLEKNVRRNAAPVLIVDPRAGHGPGIGGFKRDSEVGMALREGHPVYFAVFDPDPVEGQTLGAVIGAVARFIEIVGQRHRGREPIVYGNCQGGWTVVLALAHCRRHAGLAVLNGSPLSYWAGEWGTNPMRVAGGLLGGVWPAHFAADAGAGRFDGAWLVQNFEGLRPEEAWKKYDALWADPEREHDRFLEFERWWNGFYFLGRDEIVPIVRDLFIGNKPQKGEMVVDKGCRADLRRIQTPLVIFSSYADNITPPQQALGWLRSLYGSTGEIAAAGQRIVYLLDRHVGHLGIFVSSDVARRQHRAILHHARTIGELKPGLYEMVLPDGESKESAARFEPRVLEDLPFEPEPPGFAQVGVVSSYLDAMYTSFVSPWVRLAATSESAQLASRLHPMRTSRQVFSEDETPAMRFAPALKRSLAAEALPRERRDSNPWYQVERASAALGEEWLRVWRVWRDQAAELAFQSIYAGMPASVLVDKPAQNECCCRTEEGDPGRHVCTKGC